MRALAVSLLLAIVAGVAWGQMLMIRSDPDPSDAVGAISGELVLAAYGINGSDQTGLYKFAGAFCDTTTGQEVGFPILAAMNLISVHRRASDTITDDTLKVFRDQTLIFAMAMTGAKNDSTLTDTLFTVIDSVTTDTSFVATPISLGTVGDVISVMGIDGPGAAGLQPDEPMALLVLRYQ